MALFNDDSVLVRTSEGELAARQPRRVASNRARAALLLLDGQLSVGEMKRRFGETLAVDDALMELLRDGLAVDRDDVITDADDDLPVMNRQAGMEEPPTEMPVDPNLSIPPGFVIAGMPRSAASPESERDYRPSQPASVVSEPAEGELDVDASIDAAYASKSRPRPPPAAPVRPREPSVWPLLLDRARFHLTRGARGAMGLLVVVLVAILMVLVWKSPEWFRGEIEERARLVSGVVVNIEQLSPAWRDGPLLRLSGLTVGEAAVPIASVEIGPDWGALLRQADLALSARIVGLTGTPTQLAELLNRADLEQMRALRITLDDLRLNFNDKLGLSLSGQGEVSEGVLQSLVLSAGDDGLAFRVAMPLSFPLEFSASARDWRAPFLPDLLLESIQFEGMLSDQGMQVVSCGGAVHGGRYGGTLEIGWQDGVVLQGVFELEGVRLERLMPALRPAGDLEGGLSGQLTLKSGAPTFGGLGEAMALQARVEIERGRFGGLDLGAIMRERGTGVVRGGATRFDSMHLDIGMNAGNGRVSAAIRRFDAGNLHVGGALQIAADDVLTGRLTSMLSAGDRSVSLPVVVSGTLGSPALRLAPEAVQ